MNSCGSTELSACAPPLRMFIIGTGSRQARHAAEIAIQRGLLRCGSGARDGHGNGQNRVRAEVAFVGSAIELDHLAVDRGLQLGVVADEALARCAC